MNITILCPTYNSSSHILNSIYSFSNQSFVHKHFILIDGLSNDCTVDLFKLNFLGNHTLIVEKDSGIYDALNKGIEHSYGDIIGILHSDDAYPSNNILYKVNELFEKTNCDGVYGDLNFIKNGKIVRGWKSRKFDSSFLNKGWMPPHPTLFLKKEVFEKHGLYDTNFKIAADYDFILRIFKDESLKFEYLPMVITNMSIGGLSTSGYKNLVQKSYEDYLVLKKNKMMFPLLILFRKIVGKISQFYAI